MISQAQTLLDKHRAASATPIDYELFLSTFGEKDRKALTRHIAAYELKLGPDAAERWCRFARLLMTLAPHPAKLAAQQAIRFFVPDGKYRKQVFALQALDEGALAVYTVNVLAEGVRAGILAEPQQTENGTIYRIRQSGEPLAIDTLDGNTPYPAPLYTAMTGWNRKAMCITLPAHSSTTQIEATERLCALAAMAWSTIPQAG